MTDSPLQLPGDLTDFLRAGRSLEYEPDACEAGLVSLVPLDALRLELFPVDSQSTPLEQQDPNGGGGGCYLVEAVNLTLESDEYDGAGLLLWLPKEARYGTWDASHPYIRVFSADVTWTAIASAPPRYINAQWEGAFDDSAPVEPLVPWPRYQYVSEQHYEPQPTTG